MARVIFERVSKVFGDVVALHELDLEVHDGEFLVLVGPSGCGKTTALRLVAGLEEATSGHIYIGDRLVDDLPPKDRDVAMVFQSYALYPHMNVFDNIANPLLLRKVPRREVEERVRQVAELLGISDLLHRKPKELSGGQRQRVALGRAIIRNPAVFLMDEPLSNLDAKLRLYMRAELIKLHERLRTTTIYVTHDQQEAMTLGDRIAVLHQGVLQQIGWPQELYERPANMFVAGFIGSPAMNFFEGRLVAADGFLCVQCRGFCLAIPPERARAYERYVNQEVILGIRPEHLYDRREVVEAPPGSTFQAIVDVVEPLGNETLVYLTVEGQHFIARLGPDLDLRRRQVLELVADTHKLHLFDKKTQRALR
jgi:multiple sugar transport system ATP-binding protein